MLSFKKWAIIAMGLVCLNLNAEDQLPSQIIRGMVFDQDTKVPLIGVAVYIKNTSPIVGTISDVNGNFEFEPLTIGRYTVCAQFLGYETVEIPDVLVTSAKEVVVKIAMRESVNGLKEIKVTGNTKRGEARNSMAMISARSFSVEETQRYAGGFNDPARMAGSYAGVMNSPAGNNEIIVRGNSPRGLLWRIDGVPISNPNHFAQEGATGGAISMLNSAMLANSDFYTSAFPAEFGNATSGVFDIKLREGNSQKHEYTLQAGLLGVDGTAEGPLSKESGGSFLVNGRYSTLALLKNMGVKVAGEAVPQYGDMSFKVTLPGCKKGKIQLFGLGGFSNIKMDEEEDSKEDFTANMMVTGMNFLCPLSEKTYFKTTASYTNSYNKWYYEEFIDQSGDFEFRGRDKFLYQTVRVGSELTHKVSSGLTLKGGAFYNHQFYDMHMTLYDDEQEKLYTALEDKGNAGFYNGYISGRIRPTGNLTLTAGAHFTYLNLNNNYSIDPRLGLRYRLDAKNTITAGAGLHSKAENISIYLARTLHDDGTLTQHNKDLEMMKSIHYVLGWENRLSPTLLLKLETYYQSLYDVPVENDSSSSYSILNEMSGYITEELVNTGTGTNYGVELTLEKYLSKGYYYLFTTSLFDAKYKALDNVERNTRFNNGYIVNFTGGKEFTIGKEKNKTLGINMRTTIAGGNFYSPIDVDESMDRGYTYRPDETVFTKQRDAFYKVDFKLSYRINKKKTTQTLEFDIQNITNAQSVIYDYWDNDAGKIENEYQWALFPVVNYRIEF